MIQAIKAGQKDVIWDLHDKVTKLNCYHYDQMLKVLSEDGSVKKAFKVYNAMKKNHIKPKIYTYHMLLNALINGAEGGAYVERAIYVLEEIKRFNVLPNLHTFNYVLLICAKEKNFDVARSVIALMGKGGIVMDVSTYSIFLSSFNSTDIDEHLDDVLSIWREMASQMQPDLRSVNTMLNLFKDSSNPLFTVKFFNEEIKDKLNVDYRTYDILIRSCSSVKAYKEAEAVIENYFEVIEDHHPDAVMLNNILRIYSHTSVTKMKKFLKDWSNLHTKFNATTYEICIPGFSRFGEIDEAIETFKYCLESGFSVSTTRILSGLLIGIFKDIKKLPSVIDLAMEYEIIPDEVCIKNISKILIQNKSTRYNDIVNNYLEATNSQFRIYDNLRYKTLKEIEKLNLATKKREEKINQKAKKEEEQNILNEQMIDLTQDLLNFKN